VKKNAPFKRFSALSKLRKRLSGSGKPQASTAVSPDSDQGRRESKAGDGTTSLFQRRQRKKQEKEEEEIIHYQYVTVEHWTDET
jgi:hypothetical protein